MSDTKENSEVKKDKNQEVSKEIEKQEKQHPEEADILDELPPQVRKVMEVGLSMQRISGPLPNPFLEKVESKHIDKILSISEKESDHDYSAFKFSKYYTLAIVIIIIAVIIFLIIFLVDSQLELLQDILKATLIFAGGLGTGYGIKRVKG